METRTIETVEIPSSFCYGGIWRTAQWSAKVVDEAAGDVLLTAYLPTKQAALRLTMADVATLRKATGLDGPLPVDEARAELAYLRECAQYAADMLARGRTAGQDWRQAANNAESYLRQTLATILDCGSIRKAEQLAMAALDNSGQD